MRYTLIIVLIAVATACEAQVRPASLGWNNGCVFTISPRSGLWSKEQSPYKSNIVFTRAASNMITTDASQGVVWNFDNDADNAHDGIYMWQSSTGAGAQVKNAFDGVKKWTFVGSFSFSKTDGGRFLWAHDIVGNADPYHPAMVYVLSGATVYNQSNQGAGTGGSAYLFSTATVTTSTWYYYGATHDITGTAARSYLNGSLANEDTTSAGLYATETRVATMLGAKSTTLTTATQDFDGKVGTVWFFDRVLTAKEIAILNEMDKVDK